MREDSLNGFFAVSAAMKYRSLETTGEKKVESTWVALISHCYTLRARPVNQIEVNVTQVQLRQAVKGTFHSPLTLILRAQLTEKQEEKQGSE